uniref:Bm10793, isoform h n=1 Tax=Brugia malayi TaxID=6279 RepID=A0A1I9G4D3_BRUMA|nr:Bm10793, isoform h [Brugia malayi]
MLRASTTKQTDVHKQTERWRQCGKDVGVDESEERCSEEYSADNAPSFRKVTQHSAKRLLIIDAMNVMHMRTNHAGRTQKQLDCLSLLPVIRYFVRRGHAVEVVMPELCIYKKCYKNFHIWKDLRALKLLILVPHMMHDDLVALTVARDACGSVITKDKFRDHLACFPQLHQVRSRNINLTFISNMKKPMFFTNAEGDKFYAGYFMCVNYAFEQFYSLPEDDDYDLVENEKWSEERRMKVLERIDEIYRLAEAQYKFVKEYESIKALFYWRSTAEKQELEYQLQGRCSDAYMQTKNNLHSFDSSVPLFVHENTSDRNSKSNGSKSSSVIIEENAAYKESLTEVTNPSYLEMWIAHKKGERLFKDDKYAESKTHLWKTLTDEVKMERKSFHDFLSSFHGTLEKEVVLNAYYDQLSSYSQSEEEITNPLGIEKRLMQRWLVNALNLDSKVLHNILRSWDESPLLAERVVDAYFEHINDWETGFSQRLWRVKYVTGQSPKWEFLENLVQKSFSANLYKLALQSGQLSVPLRKPALNLMYQYEIMLVCSSNSKQSSSRRDKKTRKSMTSFAQDLQHSHKQFTDQYIYI